MIEKLKIRRKKIRAHIKDLIAREQHKEADGWELRLIELNYLIRRLSRLYETF